MKRATPFVLLLLLGLAVAGCRSRTSEAPTTVDGATVVGTTATAVTAPPPAPAPAPLATPIGLDDGPPRITAPRGRSRIIRGTGQLVGPAPTAIRETADGDVNLNFTNADVRDVAKAVLGDILGLTYAVAPEAEGQLTIQTGRPIRRQDVLRTFEVSLRAAELGILREGDLYTVLPLRDAQRRGAMVGAGEPGYGTEAIPLRFVGAEELRALLQPLVPPDAKIAADEAHAQILVTGNTESRRSLRDLIGQFDVDWLRGVSFGLIVPRWTEVTGLVEQLTQLLNAEGVPTAGTLRFVPIRQVNGVLVISTRADYLERVRGLVDMLDQEAQGTRRRLFVYRVQNGRAADLAKVLANAFGGEGASAAATTTAASPSPSPAASGTASLAGAGGTTMPGFETDDSLPMPTMDGTATTAPLSFDLGENEGAVTISADETTNSIVVHARPAQYEIVEDALRRLDVLPLQVMIESAVTEVTLNEELRYGVQWFFQTGNSSFTLSEFASGAIGQIFPGFSYLVSNGDSITGVLNALSEVTNIDVVSAPKLLVLNNQTATLQVGDQVPIATQSAQSVDTSDSRVVNSIEYRDTGIILRITPRVNDNGLVLLDIAQEVSNVVKTSTSDLDSPTIQQRRIASSIAVQDGQTVALGGLITEDRQEGGSGIPVLRKIPVLGALFGAKSRTRERTELLILLTPRVIRNAVDARRVTDELRDTIRSIEPLPVAADKAAP
ncbi:type II secretion system secretin GspD [Zavarzinia compransoris]|uniref:type II secretion system secretin GspD n=1 Tax=Zavarzinia marina TaxID=2911065 RepID=UPI001F3AE48F|nr:type II secretion system secretin GspD [Zavarzinia marina]MCF4164782.1 type II secretion system secretin GspD [Zavarzinia marina]